MTSSGSTKSERRRTLLDGRAARSADEIDAARTAIVDVILAHWSAEWTTVGAYVPLRTEPGSTQLLDRLRALGSRVIVPIVEPDRDLDWRQWPDGPGPLGRDAIASVGVVFVPALAVDSGGRRLGRGAGSYDRALVRVPAGVPIVALLYANEFISGALPADVWDRPVSAVVTPAGWHWFGSRNGRLDGARHGQLDGE